MTARVWINGQLTESGVSTVSISSPRWASPTDPSVQTLVIQNSGTLTGSIAGFGGTYSLSGGSFANVASSAGLDGNTTVINANVVGVGTYHLGTFHAGSGKLEFMHSVGSGQTIRVEDGYTGHSTLQIDHPSQFHAAIDWETADSVIDLNGLVADSYAYRQGVLDFFHNGRLVEAIRFTSTNFGLYPFAAAQGTSTGGAGVEIYTPANVLHSGVPHGEPMRQVY